MTHLFSFCYCLLIIIQAYAYCSYKQIVEGDNLKIQAEINSILSRPTGSWIQIGSNTLNPAQVANYEDPFIAKLKNIPKWNKFFIEPIPYLYAQLQQNIKDLPNAHAINVAISPNSSHVGNVTMYCLNNSFTPEFVAANRRITWVQGCCSFDPQHIQKHFSHRVEIQHVDVLSMTVSALIEHYKIQDIQMLMIDTEGFDYKICKRLQCIIIFLFIYIWCAV